MSYSEMKLKKEGEHMPRTRPLIRFDPRETEILGEIGKLQAMAGKSYRHLCRQAGIPYNTFMLHKKNVKDMRLEELWKFRDICEKEMGNV